MVAKSRADKAGGTTGEEDRQCNLGFQDRKLKSQKPLAVKTCGAAAVGETPNLTGESIGEIHGILECTQIHQPRNQHQKDPISLWVARKVTESGARTKQSSLFPL